MVYERSDPALRELERRQSRGLEDWASPASWWSDLERRFDGLRAEYDAAVSLDDLQDVGRRSREIMIDAANLVFHDWMVSPGHEVPSRNDAKARIEFFFAQAAFGKAREDIRRVIRASYASRIVFSGG